MQIKVYHVEIKCGDGVSPITSRFLGCPPLYHEEGTAWPFSTHFSEFS
jgi:hypothetical protein